MLYFLVYLFLEVLISVNISSYLGGLMTFFGKLDYSVADAFYEHTRFLDYVVLELDSHTKTLTPVQ